MRTDRLALVLLTLLCAISAFAAVTERVLPNGLRVLITDVHAAPVVTVDMWYKVGSRNERPGITGASHLLEHMTYKGTKEFSKDEMKALAKRNGAIDNGATYFDYTHYYTTIASDRLELPLQLEASRMQSALIRQEDLDAERTVVRSELEGRENNPGSLLFTELMAAAFTAHPYQWPVIGWRDDVEHTTAAELQQYYKTYYAPNNATLVIAGDVDPVKTMVLVRKHFASIARKAEPQQWTTPEREQRGERRVMVRRQGKVPMAMIAWHAPGLTHADVPAFMVLEQILGAGRLSRMYQRIVETQLGVSGWAGMLNLRDSSLFYVGGAAAPGIAIAPIETALLDEVEKIKTTPPTAEEMARAVRQVEASNIYGRDSVTQQAEQLGYYATVAGDWRLQETLLAKVKLVTPAEVSRIANTYLTADNRTVGLFEPTQPGAPTATAGEPAPAEHQPTAATAPTAPTVGNAKAGAAQRARFALPNGLVLVVQENHANATVAVSASVKAGRAYDPQGKTGTADLVANLLDRGTQARTSMQIAGELEGAAAELSAGTGWETTGIHGKALSGDTALLFRNMADLLRNPIFPQEELEKMREQMLAGLAMERDAPADTARRDFYRAVLPEGHPYRLASFDEEEAGLKSITRDDLLAFHVARYAPDSMIIAVVGDVKIDEVRQLVEAVFGDWPAKTPAMLTFPAPAPRQAARVVTRIADKAEVSIYVGTAGDLKRIDPDYYAAQLMNLILGGGGALNSRLGEVIRDQHGLAYSVYSGFHASTGAGPWYTVLGVNPANTDKAIELLEGEITRMHDKGVTIQEVHDAIAYLTGVNAIQLETNEALANTLQDAEYFSLGLDYPERMGALYKAVTPAQVNAAAKKYLHPEALVVSIAGNYGKQ